MADSLHPHGPHLSELCDESCRLAVRVTRFIAAGGLTGDAACWDAAHDCAEAALGPDEGPRLVANAARIMRALRAERTEPWMFMPAPCCRATPDEADLVAALGFARALDSNALAALAGRLARAPSAPLLAAALRTAAEMLDAIEPRDAAPPVLRRPVLH